MKNKAKKILLNIPGFQFLCRFLTKKHIRVLMYHRFSAEELKDQRFVGSIKLQEQLRWFFENPLSLLLHYLLLKQGRKNIRNNL